MDTKKRRERNSQDMDRRTAISAEIFKKARSSETKVFGELNQTIVNGSLIQIVMATNDLVDSRKASDIALIKFTLDYIEDEIQRKPGYLMGFHPDAANIILERLDKI